MQHSFDLLFYAYILHLLFQNVFSTSDKVPI